jgi:hypothetical protein
MVIAKLPIHPLKATIPCISHCRLPPRRTTFVCNIQGICWTFLSCDIEFLCVATHLKRTSSPCRLMLRGDYGSPCGRIMACANWKEGQCRVYTSARWALFYVKLDHLLSRTYPQSEQRINTLCIQFTMGFCSWWTAMSAHARAEG